MICKYIKSRFVHDIICNMTKYTQPIYTLPFGSQVTLNNPSFVTLVENGHDRLIHLQQNTLMTVLQRCPWCVPLSFCLPYELPGVIVSIESGEYQGFTACMEGQRKVSLRAPAAASVGRTSSWSTPNVRMTRLFTWVWQGFLRATTGSNFESGATKVTRDWCSTLVQDSVESAEFVTPNNCVLRAPKLWGTVQSNASPEYYSRLTNV